jgi:hypothetical protein
MTTPAAGWTPEQLRVLHDVAEIRITPADGASPGRLIWVLELDGHVIVRSWKGPDKTWYRDVVRAGGAEIQGDGIAASVEVRAAPEFDEAADAEFLRKYGDPYATEMTLPLARQTTLELLIG